MEFLLPFFFIFGITFALLTSVGKSTKIEVFKNAPVNVIISLVFGFLGAGNAAFRQFFFNNGPILIFTFVGLFIFAFLLEVLGLRGSKRERMKQNPIMMLIVGGLVLLGLTSFLFFFGINTVDIPVIGAANLFMGIGLLLVVMMLVYAYNLGKGKSDGE